MEDVILSSLVRDEEYARKVIPHLEEEYFKGVPQKIIFTIVRRHIEKRDASPTKTEIEVEVSKLRGNVPDELLGKCVEKIVGLWKGDDNDPTWLLENTEKFAKDRALDIALGKSLAIVTGDDKKTPREAIPEIMLEALSVNFDTRIGHDYHGDSDDRWLFYNDDSERFPFHIDQFNVITGGGLPKKTLTAALAGTNVGKTTFLCDFAANGLRLGKNVLYISYEITEEMISQRVDANILKTSMSEVPLLDRSKFNTAIDQARQSHGGRLIVKEYPNKSAGALRIKALCRDLRTMKNFVPDIIIVDYLNICGCDSLKPDAGLYSYSKAVTEELRALAQELDVPVLTATQTNRQGQSNSDVSIEDVSESHGTSQTVDFMFALIRTANLVENGKILVKQLKSRFGDKSKLPKFLVGVDMETQSLYQLGDSIDSTREMSSEAMEVLEATPDPFEQLDIAFS